MTANAATVPPTAGPTEGGPHDRRRHLRSAAAVLSPPGLTRWAGTLPEHISPTAAKAYLGCSLKFYFERVACIRKNTPVALHLGKAVHAALQVFHLARWRGGDDSPETIAAAFEKSFADLERDEGPVNFDDDAEREKSRLDGLRVVAAYLDSPEAMKEKPRAVEVLLKEEIPGLSVPLTGAMDLVEGNFTPVDFKSAAAKPDPANAAFDHEIQLVSYQLLLEAATGESPPSLDLVFLVKTKTPQVIRVPSPAGRRAPQTPGHRPAGNRRRRHSSPPLSPAARHAVLVVPVQKRMHALAARPGAAGKEGGLMYRRTMLLAVLLMLGGCREDPPDPGQSSKSSQAAEAARIEKEVVQRVAVVEQDLKVRQTRLHTYRTLGFIVLAGGAVGGLIWLQHHRSSNPAQSHERPLQLTRWWDHYTVPSTRVLELPPAAPTIAPPIARIETHAPPRRRRASRHPNRNRNCNRNRNRGNHPDETARHP